MTRSLPKLALVASLLAACGADPAASTDAGPARAADAPKAAAERLKLTYYNVDG
ncbi:MAG: hypothetical protein ACON4Z_14345 [Planctomycetota bacterium]